MMKMDTKQKLDISKYNFIFTYMETMARNDAAVVLHVLTKASTTKGKQMEMYEHDIKRGTRANRKQ